MPLPASGSPISAADPPFTVASFKLRESETDEIFIDAPAQRLRALVQPGSPDSCFDSSDACTHGLQAKESARRLYRRGDAAHAEWPHAGRPKDRAAVKKRLPWQRSPRRAMDGKAVRGGAAPAIRFEPEGREVDYEAHDSAGYRGEAEERLAF